jgi:hypothetical protein
VEELPVVLNKAMIANMRARDGLPCAPRTCDAPALGRE